MEFHAREVGDLLNEGIFHPHLFQILDQTEFFGRLEFGQGHLQLRPLEACQCLLEPLGRKFVFHPGSPSIFLGRITTTETSLSLYINWASGN